MSINDKIEAAWEEQIPNARKWLQCSRESQLLRAAGFGFEQGYRAALRLFVLNPGEWIAMDNSEPPQVWVWYGDRDETAEPIRRLHLPTPAEVFGEGG